MKPTIKITDTKKYDYHVESIELNGKLVYPYDVFHGDVTINDNRISGEHGVYDYEQEYGFIIQ